MTPKQIFQFVILLCFMFCSCNPNKSYSITRYISGNNSVEVYKILGKVIDADTGEPIIGAEIKIGSKRATSDIEGKYVIISSKVGQVDVEISSVGYYKIKEKIKTVIGLSIELNFFLAPEEVIIQEVT